MSYGYAHQGPPPSYNSTFDDDEPLFSSPPEDRLPSMKRTPYQHSTSIFGAPPMGEPAEPSAHPDNKTAAMQTGGPSSVTSGPSGSSYGPSGSGYGPSGSGYGQQGTSSFENPTATWGAGSKTNQGVFNSAPPRMSTSSAYQQQTTPQPGVAGTVPAGVQPGSPYIQTQSVPAAGTSR